MEEESESVERSPGTLHGALFIFISSQEDFFSGRLCHSCSEHCYIERRDCGSDESEAFGTHLDDYVRSYRGIGKGEYITYISPY